MQSDVLEHRLALRPEPHGHGAPPPVVTKPGCRASKIMP